MAYQGIDPHRRSPDLKHRQPDETYDFMPQGHMLLSLLPRKAVVRSLDSIFEHDTERLDQVEAHRA